MDKLRKSRTKIEEDKYDILKPIDILTLGSEEDPCFGALHDLKAPECIECGDSEFCSIMKSQNLHKNRVSIETEQRFKDIEESEFEMNQLKRQAKNLITKYKAEGKPRIKTVLIISRKLNLNKDIVKKLYDSSI
jgi:hypothetical protein